MTTRSVGTSTLALDDNWGGDLTLYSEALEMEIEELRARVVWLEGQETFLISQTEALSRSHPRAALVARADAMAVPLLQSFYVDPLPVPPKPATATENGVVVDDDDADAADADADEEDDAVLPATPFKCEKNKKKKKENTRHAAGKRDEGKRGAEEVVAIVLRDFMDIAFGRPVSRKERRVWDAFVCAEGPVAQTALDNIFAHRWAMCDVLSELQEKKKKDKEKEKEDKEETSREPDEVEAVVADAKVVVSPPHPRGGRKNAAGGGRKKKGRRQPTTSDGGDDDAAVFNELAAAAAAVPVVRTRGDVMREIEGETAQKRRLLKYECEAVAASLVLVRGGRHVIRSSCYAQPAQPAQKQHRGCIITADVVLGAASHASPDREMRSMLGSLVCLVQQRVLADVSRVTDDVFARYHHTVPLHGAKMIPRENPVVYRGSSSSESASSTELVTTDRAEGWRSVPFSAHLISVYVGEMWMWFLAARMWMTELTVLRLQYHEFIDRSIGWIMAMDGGGGGGGGAEPADTETADAHCAALRKMIMCSPQRRVRPAAAYLKTSGMRLPETQPVRCALLNVIDHDTLGRVDDLARTWLAMDIGLAAVGAEQIVRRRVVPCLDLESRKDLERELGVTTGTGAGKKVGGGGGAGGDHTHAHASAVVQCGWLETAARFEYAIVGAAVFVNYALRGMHLARQGIKSYDADVYAMVTRPIDATAKARDPLGELSRTVHGLRGHVGRWIADVNSNSSRSNGVSNPSLVSARTRAILAHSNVHAALTVPQDAYEAVLESVPDPLIGNDPRIAASVTSTTMQKNMQKNMQGSSMPPSFPSYIDGHSTVRGMLDDVEGSYRALFEATTTSSTCTETEMKETEMKETEMKETETETETATETEMN